MYHVLRDAAVNTVMPVPVTFTGHTGNLRKGTDTVMHLFQKH